MKLTVDSREKWTQEGNTDTHIKAYFEKTDCSGNGRMARNLVEKAILHQAGRIVKENGNLQELRIQVLEQHSF